MTYLPKKEEVKQLVQANWLAFATSAILLTVCSSCLGETFVQKGIGTKVLVVLCVLGSAGVIKYRFLQAWNTTKYAKKGVSFLPETLEVRRYDLERGDIIKLEEYKELRVEKRDGSSCFVLVPKKGIRLELIPLVGLSQENKDDLLKSIKGAMPELQITGEV